MQVILTMLDSLSIKNFRLFKELTIERLGRVNLIVGKNNSGKTGLLEALLIYASNASQLETLILGRSENWEIDMSDRQQLQPNQNPLRHLFYQRHFPKTADAGIEIGSLNDPIKRITLRTRYYQIVEHEQGTRRHIPIDESDGNDFVNVKKALEFQESRDSEPILLIDLSSIDSLKHQNKRPASMAVEWVSTCRYMNDERVAELWDNITLTDLKEEIVTSLQIIEPSIQDIGLTISNLKKRVAIARFKDSPMRISLDSLGEGLTHLFYLTLALVNSSHGFLLIDEFENGLHYSVQHDVWKLIFRLANVLDVQVFATTHSWDCVKAFQQAAKVNEQEAMLFRLGRSVLQSDQKKMIAIVYDKEKLQVVTQAEMEVRG